MNLADAARCAIAKGEPWLVRRLRRSRHRPRQFERAWAVFGAGRECDCVGFMRSIRPQV
jgi:hypothetical protein